MWRSARQSLSMVLLVAFTSGGVLAEPIKYPKPVEIIDRSFPDSIHAKVYSYEFCPDNTCDAFVAGKKFTSEEWGDFIYLYVYYFSDYYVLGNWRAQDEPKKLAQEILEKPIYHGCKNIKQADAARCVLRSLSEKSRIKIYAVRYDEKTRHAAVKKIP